MVGEGLLSVNYVQNCTRNRVLKVFEYLTLDCCAFPHRVESLNSVNPGRCNGAIPVSGSPHFGVRIHVKSTRCCLRNSHARK